MEGLATGARTEVFLSATLFCRSCCWTIARRHPLLPDIFLIDVALVWIMIESLNPLINWLIWIVGKWILCCLLSTTAAEFVKLSLASRQQPHYISTAGKLATCKYLLLRNWCRESHVCTLGEHVRPYFSGLSQGIFLWAEYTVHTPITSLLLKN